MFWRQHKAANWSAQFNSLSCTAQKCNTTLALDYCAPPVASGTHAYCLNRVEVNVTREKKGFVTRCLIFGECGAIQRPSLTGWPLKPRQVRYPSIHWCFSNILCSATRPARKLPKKTTTRRMDMVVKGPASWFDATNQSLYRWEIIVWSIRW